METIKRLPRNVHGSLRSGVVMFDLPRVVEELVNNSLDANPAKVVTISACYSFSYLTLNVFSSLPGYFTSLSFNLLLAK